MSAAARGEPTTNAQRTRTQEFHERLGFVRSTSA